MANWKDISRKESLYIYDVNSNSYCMFFWYILDGEREKHKIKYSHTHKQKNTWDQTEIIVVRMEQSTKSNNNNNTKKKKWLRNIEQRKNTIKRLKLLEKIVVSSAGASQPSIARCHIYMWYFLSFIYTHTPNTKRLLVGWCRVFKIELFNEIGRTRKQLSHRIIWANL